MLASDALKITKQAISADCDAALQNIFYKIKIAASERQTSLNFKRQDYTEIMMNMIKESLEKVGYRVVIGVIDYEEYTMTELHISWEDAV